VALEPKSHADVKRVIYAMGQLLGVTDAERVWRQIDMAMIEAAQSVPINRKNARVYFEVNPAPYAAGPSSFIGETLTRLGVRNIISSDLGQFPKLNPEYVVRANPEVIMVGNRTQAAIQTRPGWAGIQAIKDHSVCVFSAAQADVVVRAGPRMAEGAHIMAQCLQGRAGP
jgi:iron complex transport system substrate-binding protein